MPVLTSVWNFVKAHWQAILLVVLIGVGYAWIRHEQSASVAAIAQLNAAHQQEMDAINKARSDEEAQHQQELQQYQTQLAQIQQQYAEAQAQLAQQQQVEQTQIVKKYGNDAKGLADLAASKFGFVVQVPPSQ
jgi:uncharacterized protein YlxW (UPF0749 family)